MKKAEKGICPKCGRSYTGYPAISRIDNKTEICSYCGLKEALEAAGVQPGVRQEISAQIIKDQYRPGMRIRLVSMNDPHAPPIGTEGTVRGVDDIGSVMVAWDNGSGLNVVLDEDEIEIVR